MTIKVLDIIDQEDGSAILSVDMDETTLKQLASIGLLKLITDAANEVIDMDKQNHEQSVSTYIDDAIKIIENRTNQYPSSYDSKEIIETMSEVCENVLNILNVAKSMIKVEENR